MKKAPFDESRHFEFRMAEAGKQGAAIAGGTQRLIRS